jgi:hypothetical protein
MNSPIFKTALMGLLALVAAGIAAAYFPWPETVIESEMVDKPLFEEYDISKVRSISIVRYDTNRNGLERIQLERLGEKWIIPANSKFIATNAAQIGLSVNCLKNCIVLENRSSNQENHVEYGVIDPVEYESTPNRSSLGTKIVLQDRNNKELASLIVGSTLKNQSDTDQKKNFVRIPGEPNVYVVEIDRRALATTFPSWVNPNLMQLSQENKIDSIEFKNYRVDPAQIGTNGDKRWLYRASINIKDQAFKLTAPDKNGEMVEIEPRQEDTQKLGMAMSQQMGQIFFTDVKRKPAATAAKLKRLAKEDDTSGDLDPLGQFGFAKVGFEDGFQFDATGGEVIVRTADGVNISLLIGTLATNSSGNDKTLNQHVMLYATVNESVFEVPERATPSSDPAEAEKQNKAYLRKVQARRELIKSARQRADDLNQGYANWCYVVSEKVIEALRPELSIDVLTQKVEIDKAAEKDDATKRDEQADDETTNDPSQESDAESSGTDDN